MKEASSPTPIPLSPNYFDVLSKEQDAPPEERALQEKERELPGLQRAIALRKDPKGKAPILLREPEARATEVSPLSESRGSAKDLSGSERSANLPEGGNSTAPELVGWTNYSTCRWIEDPDPSNPAVESLPRSPDLIPDSAQ